MTDLIDKYYEGVPFLKMKNKTILVTGATGLIGSEIISILVAANQKYRLHMRIIALVRNIEKAHKVFGECVIEQIELWKCDISNLKTENKGIHYIIHGANQTSSKAFVEQPVDTVMTGIKGTYNILELARMNPIESFVFLSTMEIYGCPQTDEKIYENHASNLDTMQHRSCYPESKRMCENLCVDYLAQYQIPAKVVRLTQTFGEGVRYDDKRVFAEFARCVIEDRDIVLNTTGETKRNYLYVKDAVSAIFIVLLKGESGKAYNAANEATYCSIYEMANLVAKECSLSKINVIVKEQVDITKLGYAPTLKMNLSTNELQSLGWKAKIGLVEAYNRMINYMTHDL